jgi:hypothetical protein
MLVKLAHLFYGSYDGTHLTILVLPGQFYEKLTPGGHVGFYGKYIVGNVYVYDLPQNIVEKYSSKYCLTKHKQFNVINCLDEVLLKEFEQDSKKYLKEVQHVD